MTKVKITCGGYGRALPGKKVVRTAYLDEVIEVEDAEARRLESIGAAAIITKGKIATKTGCEIVATLSSDGNDSGTGEAIAADENGASELETATLDPAQLDKLTVKQLSKLAEEMGVDVSKCKLKPDYIDAIRSVEVTPGPNVGTDNDGQDDDAVLGGIPPGLSVEGPVE